MEPGAWESPAPRAVETCPHHPLGRNRTKNASFSFHISLRWHRTQLWTIRVPNRAFRDCAICSCVIFTVPPCLSWSWSRFSHFIIYVFLGSRPNPVCTEGG